MYYHDRYTGDNNNTMNRNMNRNNRDKYNGNKDKLNRGRIRYAICFVTFCFFLISGLFVNKYLITLKTKNNSNSNNDYMLGYTNSIVNSNVNLYTFNNYTLSTFIIDTGATSVSIPYKLALKLGLEKYTKEPLCDNVNYITANGLRGGCRYYFKEIILKNCRAFNVEATLSKHHLDSDEPLLGLSFLRNFKLVLDKGRMKLYC
jgi:clan AA aspartic protease (TIGR02281 family)